MNDEFIKKCDALRASIEHHKRNLEDPKNAKISGVHCPCCIAFKGCDGCPVAIFTNETNCQDTPWGTLDLMESKMTLSEYKLGDVERFQEAERMEIQFLEWVYLDLITNPEQYLDQDERVRRAIEDLKIEWKQ